jgi:hypothetical protein
MLQNENYKNNKRLLTLMGFSGKFQCAIRTGEYLRLIKEIFIFNNLNVRNNATLKNNDTALLYSQ